MSEADTGAAPPLATLRGGTAHRNASSAAGASAPLLLFVRVPLEEALLPLAWASLGGSARREARAAGAWFGLGFGLGLELGLGFGFGLGLGLG